MDVATGIDVGAARLNIYEDSLPPESVSDLQLTAIGRTVTLSWTPVLTEEKSGLKEHIAYYEILRNGKVVTRTIAGDDSHKPRIEWRDPHPLSAGARYSVRAVDEAGNISKISPYSSAKVPGYKK